MKGPPPGATSAHTDEPPEPPKSLLRPAVVELAVELLSCSDLNIKTESFCVEIVVHTRWQHPDRTSSDEIMKVSGGDENEHWEPEWFPRIKVHNMNEELTERERYFVAARTTDDHVTISGTVNLNVKISESYNLEAFPFDMQWLEAKLEISNAHKIMPMRGPAPPSRAWGSGFDAPIYIQRQGVEKLPDFILSGQIPVSYKYTEGDRMHASTVSIVLMYDRAYNYHVYNSYGVLCGIGTICLAIWALPVDEVGTRLSLDITLLLVLVAFKQVLSSELPPVSYLTILDRYALTTISFVFAATWLHGMVGLAEAEGHVDVSTLRVFDMIGMGAYLLAFCGYNLWHLALVKTQIFYNDVMTDERELPVYGYSAAQMLRIDEDGRTAEPIEDGRFVYGQYKDRPNTCSVSEIWSVAKILIAGLSRHEARQRHEQQVLAKAASRDYHSLHDA